MGRRSDVVVYSMASKGARPDFLEELSELTGGWHKLEVRVNKPGARVKARPGYHGG